MGKSEYSEFSEYSEYSEDWKNENTDTACRVPTEDKTRKQIDDMSEILMTPDVCMQFLVWSYYYHGVMPQKDVSYAECGLFSEKDVARLDELKDTLFKCFKEDSVVRACQQFQLAKHRGEPCPFPQQMLDRMFAG